MKWDDITRGGDLAMRAFQPRPPSPLEQRQARERAELKAHLDATREARAWEAATKEYLEGFQPSPRREAH